MVVHDRGRDYMYTYSFQSKNWIQYIHRDNTATFTSRAFNDYCMALVIPVNEL